MDAFLVNKRIDLVDFDDVKIFMLEEDSLYLTAVPQNRKHQNAEDFQRQIIANGPPSSADTRNVDQIKSSKYGVCIVMHHLWANGVKFDVLDVGSHIGDFGVRVASLVRAAGTKTRVVTFDPSEAGALVPYTIEINQLSHIAKHEMLAVSDTDGLALFQYRPGHSDEGVITGANQSAAGLASTWLKRFQKLPWRKRIPAYIGLGFSAIKRLANSGKIVNSYSLIARSIDILGYLKRNNFNDSIFVKIDIEGHDPRVIDRLLHLLPDRHLFIIFEFTPVRFDVSGAATEYLVKLSQHFLLFDLYYCPNPTRFKRIPPEQIPSFATEVADRPHGYTDVLLLDKRTPNIEPLVQRLAQLKPETDAQMLLS